MNILLASATAFEVDLKKIWQTLPSSEINITDLITGVGLPNAMYQLTKAVHTRKYDLVIQAGIAGAIDSKVPLASVVVVKKDMFADVGIYENGNFSSLHDIGFGDKDQFPFSNGWLVNNNILNSDLPYFSGITVNTVTDDKTIIANQTKLYNADVESMEGAALHYVCLLNNIPFLQLRSISNAVGERDKSKWQMAKAIESLNEALLQVLYNIIHS